MAVGIGTCGRSDRNRAGRQTQGILHLDVTGGDEEVTRHIVVDGGIKDQATRTNLRKVSRAREDARGGISRGGPNIERHFTSQGDDGARPDRTIGRGRQGGARLERNRPRQGIRRDPHADFQGRPRLDGDDTRERRASEELRRTEDAEGAGGDGDITFRDGRAVDADVIGPRLSQRKAREVEVQAVTIEVPALGAADGGVRRERHRLQGVRLGEVRIIDNRARIADARARDGHRPARERDAVSDRRPREVQRGARSHRDGSARSAQGGIAADADRAAIDGRRTRVGIGVTENQEAIAVLRQAVRAGDDAREAEGTRGVGDADGRDTDGRGIGDGLIARDDQGARARDRGDECNITIMVKGDGGTRADRDGDIRNQRSGQRSAVADGDRTGSQGTRASHGHATTRDREDARRGEVGGREATRGLGKGRGDEVTREGGRARVAEGAGGDEVGRTERARTQGHGAGGDGTRRGECAGSTEVTPCRERANRERTVDRVDGPSDGQGLTRLGGKDTRRAEHQGSGGGGRSRGNRTIDGSGAEAQRGRARGIERGTGRDDRQGGGRECVGHGQGAVIDRYIIEAHHARERRGTWGVLEEVARTTNVDGDRGVGLVQDEGRARIERQGARTQGTGIHQAEAAGGDIGATRVGVRQVDGQDADPRLIQACGRRHVREGDGREGRREGIRSDVDDDERVGRGVDELEVIEPAGGVGHRGERPSTNRTAPARLIEGELRRGEASVIDRRTRQEGPVVTQVRVEDRGRTAGREGVIEGEELHLHRGSATSDVRGKQAVGDDDGITLGQVTRVGGLEMDNRPSRKRERREGCDAEVIPRGEDTARGHGGGGGAREGARVLERAAGGDGDRAGRDRARVQQLGAVQNRGRTEARARGARVSQSARGQDRVGDITRVRSIGANEAQVGEGAGGAVGNRPTNRGHTAADRAIVGNGTAVSQNVRGHRAKVTEGTAIDGDRLADREGCAGVIGERARVQGGIATLRAGVGGRTAIDLQGRIDRTSIREERARLDVDGAARGQRTRRSDFQRTGADRGRTRVSIGAGQDPATRAGLKDGGQATALTEGHGDRIIAKVRARECDGTVAGFGGIGIGGGVTVEGHRTRAGKLEARRRDRARRIEDTPLVADGEEAVRRLGGRARILQGTPIEGEVGIGTGRGALTDRRSRVDVRELGDVEQTTVLHDRAAGIDVSGTLNRGRTWARHEIVTDDEHRPRTGVAVLEGARRREHEVTRTIEVQVATRLAGIRFNDATKGQRGTSEGTHRGAAATAREQDRAAHRIITGQRSDEAERRHGRAVRTLARESKLVTHGHAAIQLDLQLQGAGTTD